MSELSTGAIVGIVIAVFIILAIITRMLRGRKVQSTSNNSGVAVGLFA